MALNHRAIVVGRRPQVLQLVVNGVQPQSVIALVVQQHPAVGIRPDNELLVAVGRKATSSVDACVDPSHRDLPLAWQLLTLYILLMRTGRHILLSSSDILIADNLYIINVLIKFLLHLILLLLRQRRIRHLLIRIELPIIIVGVQHFSELIVLLTRW